MNPNNRPRGFAADDSGDDAAAAVAVPAPFADLDEPADLEDDPRLKPREPRRGKLMPAAGVVSSLSGLGIGPRRTGDKGERAPVLALVDMAPAKAKNGEKPSVVAAESATPPDVKPPEAFVCPKCGDRCEYAFEPLTERAVETGRRVRFARRPLCVCEKERALEGEEREALLRVEEREARTKRALYNAAHSLILPPRLSRCSFESYESDRHKSMKAAYIEARNFAEAAALYFTARRGTAHLLADDVRQGGVVPAAPPPGLVLVGATGRGKSHLLAAVCRYLAAVGVETRFENAEAFLAAIRKEFDGRGSVGERMRAAENCDVLVLDDLGTEHIAAANPTWGRSMLYRLINNRYERELPTLVTTMIPPDRLTLHYGDIGPALISRLSVSAWLSVGGPDGRSYGRTTGGAAALDATRRAASGGGK